MTPERAQFHLYMLEADERSLFDRELCDALEEENPLSELTLALSLCRDKAETLHALHGFLLDHPADMAVVDRMLREEFFGRLERGDITRNECLEALWRIAKPVGYDFDLYQDIFILNEYREQVADGYI